MIVTASCRFVLLLVLVEIVKVLLIGSRLDLLKVRVGAAVNSVVIVSYLVMTVCWVEEYTPEEPDTGLGTWTRGG